MSWGGFFDLPAKERQIVDLEQTASKPDFWQKGDSSSQKMMAELSGLKDTLARWKSLKVEYEDIEAHWQLASEMGDESELEEIDKSHAVLVKKIDAFDLESKLS